MITVVEGSERCTMEIDPLNSKLDLDMSSI